MKRATKRNPFRGLDRFRLTGADADAPVQYEGDLAFDELVLAAADLHIEVMDDDHLWICVHGVHINVLYGSKTVLVENDECEWSVQV